MKALNDSAVSVDFLTTTIGFQTAQQKGLQFGESE